jgi:DNA polymerase
MRTTVWDLETRSAANLRDGGAHVYAIDPSTQILCLAFAVDDSEPQLWLPGDVLQGENSANPPPAIFREIAANPTAWQVIAHNYEFERAIYEHILIPRYGFPLLPLASHHCSQRLAMANAYPAELDRLAQALGLPYRKDPAARKAMLAVSRPRAQRKGKSSTVPTWDEDRAKLALLYERCELDVITTRAVWKSRKLKRLSPSERQNQLQDAIINGRGVRCDRTFVTAAKDLAIRERTAINLKLQELTHGAITSVDQTQRFLEAINARGHTMTTLNKRAVVQALASKPDDYVRQLLELRRIGARAAVNKFQAHARLRVAVRRPHARHLAHVWRWPRTLVRIGPAAAKPEKERKRPAAFRGRFHSRRRPQRYCPIWQSPGAAR